MSRNNQNNPTRDSELKEKIATLLHDCENCIGGLVPSYNTNPYKTCPVCNGLGAKEDKVNRLLALITQDRQQILEAVLSLPEMQDEQYPDDGLAVDIDTRNKLRAKLKTAIKSLKEKV